MADVTRLLDAAAAGDPAAATELLPLVYDELRKLAAAKMAAEKPGQTLQATALVHEAYARLVAGDPDRQWNGRGHFFAAAAEAMRRILINQARDKQRVKRGGGRARLDLDGLAIADGASDDQLLALDEALDLLARDNPSGAELVKLRFFSGLTQQEAATALGLPRRTADRLWAYARAWLYERLSQDD
jgi:RNA polymerase sigma factor (TIGR02999 family)